MHRRSMLAALCGVLGIPLLTKADEPPMPDGTYCRLTTPLGTYDFKLIDFCAGMDHVVLRLNYDDHAKAFVEAHNYSPNHIASGWTKTWRAGKVVAEQSFVGMTLSQYGISLPWRATDPADGLSAKDISQIMVSVTLMRKD